MGWGWARAIYHRDRGFPSQGPKPNRRRKPYPSDLPSRPVLIPSSIQAAPRPYGPTRLRCGGRAGSGNQGRGGRGAPERQPAPSSQAQRVGCRRPARRPHAALLQRWGGGPGGPCSAGARGRQAAQAGASAGAARVSSRPSASRQQAGPQGAPGI